MEIMMIAATDAESAGRVVGQVGVVALLVCGIIKCWSISRRPTTNTKCVLSLLLLLVGWSCAALAAALLGSGPGGRVLLGLLGLLMIGLVIAAVILAIIGLVEYGQGHENYVQGRSQAIWSLILCGVFLTAMVGGILRSQAGPPALSKQPTVGSSLVFQDLNFKFSAPGKPWAQIDASKLNAAAKLCFIRGAPEIYFVVSAERAGDENWTTDSMVDFSLQRMAGLAASSRVQARSPLRVGTLAGLRVEMEATIGNNPLHYFHWFCITNGWAYQLMSYGREADHEKVVAEGERLVQSFGLLDYARRPPLAGQAVASDFVSTNFGYQVKCRGPEWTEWKAIDKDCPQASFGVLHRRDAVLAVSAVSLMDLHPRPETIYRGMIETTGLGDSSKILSGAETIKEQGLEGIQTTFDVPMKNGKNFSYRLKILQGNGYAYAVMAWIASSQQGKDQWLKDALLLVNFSSPPESRPETTGWDERTRRVHRLALNSIGLQLYREGGFVDSTRYFELAVMLGGSQGTGPYLANLVEARVNAGKHREALEALEKYPDIVATQPPLQAQRAFLQGRLGQSTAAVTNYSNLFATGFVAEDHFREYIALLTQNDQTDKALAEIESFLKKQDVPGVRLLQSGLLKQRKKFDEAISMLKVQREKNRFHAGIAYALGDAYIQAGQPTEALTLSQELIQQQGNSATMMFLKGRAEFALKWYREAKDSFERVQKEAPSDPEVKNFLDATSAVLGEGANTMVKEPIAPVALPPELVALPPAPPNEFARDEGAYYLRAIKAVSFERGKELKTTEYLTVKTLNAAGVSAFSTFQITFNQLAEELYVNRLDVRDAMGSLVSTGRVSDYYVLDDRTSAAAASRKVLNLPVSGLQPGCTVELVCTRRELGSTKEFTFLPCAFSRTIPTQEEILYFRGDISAVHFASSPKNEPQTLEAGVAWRQKNPPVMRWEPLQPQLVDYIPMLWIGDATTTWTGLATNYLESIRDRMELPISQQAAARTLTAGMTTIGQKVDAIATFIQSNYTYKAVEFGRRARVPQSLGDIIRNKYGDCKDHSVLAQQMLRAAGVPASLALVSFNTAVRRDLPSLDQFDHMLVYIPMPDGEKFLDCTAKSSNLAAPWTLGLAAREALVLDAADPRFVRIPSYPTNASVIRVTRSIELTNLSDVLVREELVFNGVHAAYMRDYLRNLLPAGRHAYFAGQLNSSAAQLTGLTFEGLEQPQSPFTVHLTYTARGQFNSLENQIVGSPLVGFERAFLVHEPNEKRSTPFEMVVPLAIEGTVTVNVPSQFRPKLADRPEGRTANAFVTCNTGSKIVENGWQMNYQVYAPAGRHPASDYSDYCRAFQKALDMLKPRLVAEQGRR